MTIQASVRLDDQQYNLFKNTAEQLGTTPTEALRMLVYSFNRHGGFPDNMSMNLHSAPPQFRQKLTPDDILQHMEKADARIEAGDSYTHEEVFSKAYATIEKAKQNNKKVA